MIVSPTPKYKTTEVIVESMKRIGMSNWILVDRYGNTSYILLASSLKNTGLSLFNDRRVDKIACMMNVMFI